ncbi:MAG TPA: hypothetical protein VL049_11170 [Candidatus Dormibacteraeota bacterium]|nr:hypothetical protein [Candidatus Dormibacteraeota bacterium]
MAHRRSILVAAVLITALGLGVWWRASDRRRAAQPGAAPAASAAHTPHRVAESAAAPLPDARQPPAPPPAGADAAADDSGDELGGDAIAAAWANVDLDEVRRALPDNLYWQMGAPTRDKQEIERRERERDRWNDEYGKVLSGTGSEAEIRAYYDQRAKLSGDYVEFTTYLLDHYGEVLPARDVALLQLARRLHLARLEEIPRSLEQALLRKGQQDDARARWQAEERAFNAGDAAAPDAETR